MDGAGCHKINDILDIAGKVIDTADSIVVRTFEEKLNHYKLKLKK